MNRFPALGSVLVMDNASTHHCDELLEEADSRGILVIFLPPYSPFWNPCELVFAQVKTFLRRFGSSFHSKFQCFRDVSDIALVNLAFDYVDARACARYVRHCGYL